MTVQSDFDLTPTLDVPPPQPVDRGSGWVLLAIYAAFFVLITLGFVIGGTAGSFAEMGITFVPLTILASLAYLGRDSLPGRIITLAWLAFLAGGMALISFGMVNLAVMPPDLLSGGAAPPEIDSTMLGIIGTTTIYTGIALLISLLGFIPAVRRGLSRVVPLDPDSFVHMIALVAVTALSLVSFVPLLVLGEPALLTGNALGALEEAVGEGTDALLTQTYTLVWIIPAAIVAVGYGLRRNLAATLSRLGLVRPTFAQIGVGIGTALVLVVLVNLAEPGMAWLWERMGWPQTDGDAFGELMAFAFSPLGAVVIGVTAGLGEELGVRGILQPRLGIFLSNFFFTSLHALQYNWDALLVVFVLGSVFGLLRKRTNTSTSAIAHGVYNFTLIMMAIYEISLFGGG